MAGFDPDAYLAQKTAPAPAGGGFDPDSYLAQKSQPSAMESFARGAVDMPTLGFADEIAGGGEALLDKLRGSDEPLGDLYRRHRDESRANFKAAAEANPTAHYLGEGAGLVGSMLIPGLGEAKGLGGALKLGAKLGAAQGLGESEADLAKGDVGGAALDTAIGAGLGAAAGGVGHGLAKVAGKAVGALGQRAARGVAEATQEATNRATAGVDKEIASKLGSYRSGVQSASRDLEVLAREAEALPKGHPARVAAERLLASPEGMALREGVVAGKLGTAPDRLAEMADLGTEHAAAAAGRNAEIASRTNEMLADPIRKQVLPRLKTYATRAIPVAVGTTIGGPAGAAVGMAAGAVMGAPGTALANMMKSPAVRKAAWSAVLRALKPGLTTAGRAVVPNAGRLGSVGASIARMLQAGDTQGAQALHLAAVEKLPQYAHAVAQLLIPEGDAEAAQR